MSELSRTLASTECEPRGSRPAPGSDRVAESDSGRLAIFGLVKHSAICDSCWKTLLDAMEILGQRPPVARGDFPRRSLEHILRRDLNLTTPKGARLLAAMIEVPGEPVSARQVDDGRTPLKIVAVALRRDLENAGIPNAILTVRQQYRLRRPGGYALDPRCLDALARRVSFDLGLLARSKHLGLQS